jgi:glycosyltransferase involved in cell wall biosynthesis
MSIRLLNVNFNDLVGSQFNNYAHREALHDYNIWARFCVWMKQSNDDNVTKLWMGGKYLSRYFRGGIWVIERALSVQSMLYPFGFQLPFRKCFKQADVVHYHILHNGYFSLLTMPWLTRKKPSIWTIHDPWLMTGHCVYPMGCERWKIGCGSCPNLQLSLPLHRDTSRFLTRYKKWVVKHSKVEFVVASEWMLNMAKTSEITKDKPIHLVPFGVDLELFKPRNALDIREKYDIPPENFVIFFRSTQSPFKGLDHIYGMLHKLMRECKRPITLLNVESVGLFEDLVGKCQIVEFGWLNDTKTLSDLYAVCDVFLMPSTAEAFGVMAIEAMASGKPVVYLEGTSLGEVVKTGGVGVPMHQHDKLADVILELAHNEEKRTILGNTARSLAEKYYDVRTHLKNISDIYKKSYYRHYYKKG